jgi:hypothetical protein
VKLETALMLIVTCIPIFDSLPVEHWGCMINSFYEDYILERLHVDDGKNVHRKLMYYPTAGLFVGWRCRDIHMFLTGHSMNLISSCNKQAQYIQHAVRLRQYLHTFRSVDGMMWTDDGVHAIFSIHDIYYVNFVEAIRLTEMISVL